MLKVVLASNGYLFVTQTAMPIFQPTAIAGRKQRNRRQNELAQKKATSVKNTSCLQLVTLLNLHKSSWLFASD